MQIKQWLMGLGALVTVGTATPALADACDQGAAAVAPTYSYQAAPVYAYPTTMAARDWRWREARRRHLEWLRWQREHARYGYGYR
jgi:hypothetical protein